MPRAGAGTSRTNRLALNLLYPVICSPIANRINVAGRTTGWKAALNALALFYGERITLN
jgi:putative transposase